MKLHIRRFYRYAPDEGKVYWKIAIPVRAGEATTEDEWFIRDATERLKRLMGDLLDITILIVDDKIYIEGCASPGEAREKAKSAQECWVRYIRNELALRRVEDGEEEEVVDLEEWEE